MAGMPWSDARQSPPRPQPCARARARVHTHAHFVLPGPDSRFRYSESWLEEGKMMSPHSESPMSVVYTPKTDIFNSFEEESFPA